MNYLNFTIQLNKEEFDSFEKLSHYQKSLKIHIEEIIKIGNKFLNKYEFSENYYKALEYLAFTHDLGKLLKEWNITNTKNPTHADESVRIILKKLNPPYLFKEKEEWQIILLFFVFKHHGILRKNSFEVEGINIDLYKLLEEKLRKLDDIEKINLVDIFGIFKIADLLSADSLDETDINKSFTEISKEINIDTEKIKSSFYSIDTKRWEQQKLLLNLKNISLLRAPTGWGKTSVSLLYFINNKAKKIFYILPTITAIRDFKEKLEKIVGKDNVEAYFYFYDVEKYIEGELDLSEIFYAKNFLKPIIITTIDQFLLTFLQVGKYFLKRFNFRDSLIILDEVHLLSPLMLYLFTYLFKKFHKIYNLKLLLMSATLSKGLVEFLKENLEIKDENYLDFLDILKNKIRIKYHYHPQTDITESIEDIIKIYKKGRKVLVIINTVDKAIEIGRKLKEEFNIDETFILHSRFMHKDRIRKEKEILNRITNVPHILISTQVSEVSLDISYDYLFTELSPFASLIQRFGRVNRYGDYTKDINVEIFYPSEINNFRHYPYEKEELNISNDILLFFKNKSIQNEFELYEKLDELLTKEKIEKMIESLKTKLDLETWENYLNFFYSFPVNESSIKKILEYREGFTILALLSPDIIEDKNNKEEYEKLLDSLKNIHKQNLTFEERQRLFIKVKQFTIPIPYWIAKASLLDKGFPILELKNYSYNSYYGLYRLQSADFFI